MRWIVLLALAIGCAGFTCERGDDGDPHVTSGATPKEDVVGWSSDLLDTFDAENEVDGD